nr:MAG TPA_asm: hypothetical protein [Caudoviricetes sp.]
MIRMGVLQCFYDNIVKAKGTLGVLFCLKGRENWWKRCKLKFRRRLKSRCHRYYGCMVI